MKGMTRIVLNHDSVIEAWQEWWDKRSTELSAAKVVEANWDAEEQQLHLKLQSPTSAVAS